MAMGGGQKEGKDLPVVTQEVCGEETSPIFPSPDDAGMDNTSPASHRDAWRCQEPKRTRLGPGSPPRAVPEETAASPCFPTSPPGRGQGAAPLHPQEPAKPHPKSRRAPAPAHYMGMNHSLTSAFCSVRFLILWAVSAGLLNPDVRKMQPQHTETRKERGWWRGPGRVIQFS